MSPGRWDREVFIDLATDVRIRYCRTEPPPPIRYAVTLEVLIEDGWQTVRLWDNAHAPDEHHEHPYTPQRGKQRPRVLGAATVNEAMAHAISDASEGWELLVKQWREQT